MDEFIKFVKKHLFFCFLIFICALVVPLIVVHILFSIEASTEWLSAKWSAGDLLTYIAGFESFSGTIILGIIAVCQTRQSNRLQETSIHPILPFFKVASVHIFDLSYVGNQRRRNNFFEVADSFEESMYVPQVNVYLQSDQGADVKTFLKKVRISFVNISNVPIVRTTIFNITISGKINITAESRESLGNDGRNHNHDINHLILPKDTLDVDLNIYSNSRTLQKDWRNHDGSGRFKIQVILKNYSAYNACCNEAITIKKMGYEKEDIQYNTLDCE